MSENASTTRSTEPEEQLPQEPAGSEVPQAEATAEGVSASPPAPPPAAAEPAATEAAAEAEEGTERNATEEATPEAAATPRDADEATPERAAAEAPAPAAEVEAATTEGEETITEGRQTHAEGEETTAGGAEAVSEGDSAPAAAAAATPPVEAAETPPVEAAAPTATSETAPAAAEPARAPAEASADTPSEEGSAAAEGEAEDEDEGPPSPRQQAIDALRRAKDEETSVEGRVIGWNNGGFHVLIDDVTVFCPRSEMEIGNPRSPKVYLERSFAFRVIKHQKRGRRIVVSRKAVLAEEKEKLAAETLKKLVPGADLPGRVSSITDFGAFVDLGGLEGLVHLSELSHRRVPHPRDVVEVGQDLTVRVLKVEQGGERISLSTKALEANPWQEFADAHPRGSSFTGKVVRKTDFGIFVELAPGLDGMIHISQLPPAMDASDSALEEGQEITGWVIRTEPERERISLSLREIPKEDPWKGIAERLPEGTVVEGEVEDLAPFGAFILLGPGLTGLLPNSEMSLPRGQDKSRVYRPGAKVRVQVVTVDRQRKRISLASEGSKVAGTRADYKDYQRQQRQQGSGLSAMAAAFAKLQETSSKEGEA